MKKKASTVEKMLNTLLSPVELSYHLMQKIANKAHDSMPLVYHEVERVVRSQLVGLERDELLMHSPNIEGFTKAVADSIIKKLPKKDIDHKEIERIVKDRSMNSFLDMLTRGLGAAIEHEKDYTVLKKERLFKKVLIANRGEIALRVIRACKELGIKTVVVYTKPDKNSLAVRFGDQTYCLGTAAGYLDPKKIIAIAEKTKAEAIHPGYGFLAENVNFATMCQKKGIIFIGPTPRTIQMLGDKVRARDEMIKAKVPLLAGTRKTLKDVKQSEDIAEKIGYPVIIKAVGGGGGKGMRIVRNKGEIEKGFSSARMEATMAFDNPELYMEKYLEDPRHIEFQILADNYGNIIHLGERECSIQRRHQKLIEEAPSIALDKKLQEEMGNMAVKAVSAVGYQGAGTVEFLLDKDGRYYFIEMNTRIQVEHGITEMITGVDLVKEQIKIAAGAHLAYRQNDISIHGWAIECRINAECPEKEFCPDVGTITNYLPPGGPGIRVCSSCHTGHVVSPHYDSLIAKLICGGKTRHEAISRMKRALGEFIIDGVQTTVPFHQAVLDNKQFIKGNVSTSFIDANNIMETIKKEGKQKKKVLTRKEKILIVTTAVSKYHEQRQHRVPARDSAWVMAGRQELIGQNDNSSF